MSKNNKTLDVLIQNIQTDWIWRIKELDDYKTVLEKAKDKASQNCLIRAGITLLYAHWEGYVKYCSNCYYNYVTIKRHKLNELKECFVAIALKKELNEIINTNKISIQSKAIKILMEEFEKRAYFPSIIPLRTSNLNFDVFGEYCNLLGIDSKSFITKKQFIDQRLVKNRNNIAHGKFLTIDYDSFNEIYKITIQLISNFKSEILNSASLKLYMKVK